MDAIRPFMGVITNHDRSLAVKLVKVQGEMRIAAKAISRELVRDDDKALDYMYETIGKTLAELRNLPIDKQERLLEGINKVVSEIKEQ